MLALDSCKANMQIAALQVAIDHIGDIGPPEPAACSIAVLPVHLQLFKVVLHTAKITAGLGISGLVDADIIMLGRGMPIIVMVVTTIATIYGIM